MKIEAKWDITEDYYRSYFNDWLRGISQWRRWAVPIGLVIAICGITLSGALYFSGKGFSIAGFALVGAGVSHVIWHYLEKRKWLKTMLSASGVGEAVSLVFSNEGIEHAGPTASGKISWKGIGRIVQAPNGLFLVLQKGISIYVPLQAISPRDSVPMLLQMFEGGND